MYECVCVLQTSLPRVINSRSSITVSERCYVVYNSSTNMHTLKYCSCECAYSSYSKHNIQLAERCSVFLVNVLSRVSIVFQGFSTRRNPLSSFPWPSCLLFCNYFGFRFVQPVRVGLEFHFQMDFVVSFSLKSNFFLVPKIGVGTGLEGEGFDGAKVENGQNQFRLILFEKCKNDLPRNFV